jgi:hypothetical protein
MKYFMMAFMLTSLFTSMAYAEGESETECPWMKESNNRQNPKANVKEKTAEVKQVKSENESSAQ